MSFQQAVIEANAALRRKTTFLPVNIYQANWEVDKLSEYSFPIHILLPYEVRDTTRQGGVQGSVVIMEGFFLDKIETPTIEYNTAQMDELAVAPMRALAREFFHKLEESAGEYDILDETVLNIVKRYLPTYMEFDGNLKGVHYFCDFPINEGLTGCV